jgi:hypothetical protein
MARFPSLDVSRRRFVAIVVAPRSCDSPVAVAAAGARFPPRASVLWRGFPPATPLVAARAPLVMLKVFLHACTWRFRSLLLLVVVVLAAYLASSRTREQLVPGYSLVYPSPGPYF